MQIVEGIHYIFLLYNPLLIYLYSPQKGQISLSGLFTVQNSTADLLIVIRSRFGSCL